MKLTQKMTMLTFTHPVVIGNLKADLEAQVCCTDSPDYDIDFTDILNISFFDVPITGYGNWTKFKKFHSEMGIDFSKLLNDEFDRVFTPKALQKLVKEGLK